MKGITHSLGGVITGIAAVHIVDIDISDVKGCVTAVALIDAAVIASLLPDIDSWNSTISRRARILSIPIKILQILTKLFRIDGFEHRGIMHTLLCPILFAIGGFFTGGLTSIFLYTLSAGYLSHILLDGFNPAGVPLLAPFFRTKVTFLPKKLCIKSGSILELPVTLSLCIVIYCISKPLIATVTNTFSSDYMQNILYFFKNI